MQILKSDLGSALTMVTSLSSVASTVCNDFGELPRPRLRIKAAPITPIRTNPATPNRYALSPVSVLVVVVEIEVLVDVRLVVVELLEVETLVEVLVVVVLVVLVPVEVKDVEVVDIE